MLVTKNKVFVITGAAGSGKTTVSNYLVDKYHMEKVITHTTRKPREQEKDSIDYYFETLDSFKENHYLEFVEYAGNYYGSSFEGLTRAFEKSPLATIVLDTNGAITYKNQLKDEAVIIFLEVDDTQILYQRMLDRGDQQANIDSRINSLEYIRDLKLPDELVGQAYVVKNNNWQMTQQEIDQIVQDNLKMD